MSWKREPFLLFAMGCCALVFAYSFVTVIMANELKASDVLAVFLNFIAMASVTLAVLES
jgi:hypothetical protein